jgi:UrcA family protein
MSRFVQVLFLCCAMTIATSVCADTLAPTSVSVRSDDLDLASERGAARMLRRLERAADDVCGRAVAQHFPGQRDEYRACRAATLEAAVDQLGAPAVAALHAARHRRDEVQIADR